MFIRKLGHYPVVLGIPWSQLHDVAVRFASNMTTFGSQYCIICCHDAPGSVQGVTDEPPEPVYFGSKGIYETQLCPQRPSRGYIVMRNGYSFFRTVKRGTLMIFKASLYNINRAFEEKDLKK